MNIEKISTELKKSENGLWVANSSREISYPQNGNEAAYLIEDASFWFRYRNRCIESVIKAFQPKGQVVFDVGGGNGYVSKGLQDAGLPVVLLEPGPQGAMNAISRGVETVVCSTLQDAGFKEACLPAIGIFDVLEHIEDDGGFLELLHDSLSPEGLLYITVPAYQWLWSEDDVQAGHFRRYTASNLSVLLEQHGYQVQYASYFFSFLPVPIFFLRTLRSKFGSTSNDPIKKQEAEHNPPIGPLQKLIDKCLSFELKLIQKRKRCAFGGSIILAARKVSNGIG